MQAAAARNHLFIWLKVAAGLIFAWEYCTPRANAEQAESDAWNASGSRGAIVTHDADSAQIGLQILKDGGNAIDAAVAALLALTVTDSGEFCFGSELSIIVHDAKRGAVEVLCGQGAAPKLAARERFDKLGGIPRSGAMSATVPAALDAFVTALDRYGTRTFAGIARPTLEILDRRAEPWHAQLAATIRLLIEEEAKAGADRHAGLRAVADAFYRGQIARQIDAWSQSAGGLLRYEDLAAHKTRVEQPASVEYRGHTVYKCGPWTQGPYLLQTLRLLEGFDLPALKPAQADTIHLLIEAMKLALADRDAYYGDPLFADVPLEQLLSRSYADARRPLIDMQHASLELRPGDPLAGKSLLEIKPPWWGSAGPKRDTTTCVAADQWGNVVAATPSGWGGEFAGETGVKLGTRLQSLNTWPGHPNCIEPGKRPRITLTPTLVLKDGKPLLAISVAGGDMQDQTALQLLIDMIDFGLTPAEAVAVPRFGTNHLIGSFSQPPPELGSLQIEARAGEGTIAELKRRGHEVTLAEPPLAHPVVIRIDPESGRIEAAGDPVSGRQAAAY